MQLKAENAVKEFIREGRGTNIFTAVAENNIILESGQFTVLTGRSGSGKTTLLNMLAGLLPPTRGRIMLDGTDLYALDDKRLSRLRNERIGVIPQGQTAVYSLTVIENVLLPFMLYKEQSSEAEKYARELLERLDIAPLANVKPSELSGGELRRMSIARALIRRPSVILADEPTGDLDDENTRAVFEFLRRTADEGAAVLTVTHESDAGQYAHRLMRMNGGRLEE